MITGAMDDREAIRITIGQIRDLYKEIVQLRNEDRQKYKDMCTRLETMERDKSKRLKKHKRQARQWEKMKRKTAEKERAAKNNTSSSNATTGTTPSSAASKDTKKEDVGKKTAKKKDEVSREGTTKTDEKGPEKDE